MRQPKPLSPLQFFKHLCWIDGQPLLNVIEPYRQQIFTESLYTFDADGRPRYNWVLCGRGKKNWKSSDAILACLYRFLAWPSAAGNDIYLLASDLGQAKDDLQILKKLIRINPLLLREVVIKQHSVERIDGRGVFEVLPGGDISGSHGKTALMIAYDEVHTYRDWSLFEALSPDPSRLDCLVWVTSYASLYHREGAPLHDLLAQARRGEDPRLYFSWYSSSFTTDATLENAEPEQKANPSMASWNNPSYLSQQRRRLPTHRYRRLHLNEPGAGEGAFFSAENVLASIVLGRKRLEWQPDISYCAFCDMSGGSADDAVLAISHWDEVRKVAILDLCECQAGGAPFDPRQAVKKFAALLKSYHIYHVTSDRYAGNTFFSDFASQDISVTPSSLTASQLYESLEPRINAGEIELLDLPKLQEQLLGLVTRGTKIGHLPNEHDDWVNAASGAIHEARGYAEITDDMYDFGSITDFNQASLTGGEPYGGFFE